MASLTPTYNTAFPELHSTGHLQTRPPNQHRRSSGSHNSIQRSLIPPRFPSYLKQTLYGKLIKEQYEYYQTKHDVKSLMNNNTHFSSTNNHKSIITRSEEEQWSELDLLLPTCWNPKDKSKNIEVGSNGLDLTYIGPGKQETHAALARANFPMRPQCGLFYFEMRVISKGDDGYIGIGFCAATNKLERLPGWDPDSWGYHGDDGHSFAGSGSGKVYGPCFTTGDVIGCGVNFADNSAFYTKNGKFLGNAFTKINLNKPMFPAVGLRTPGEQVTVNFGHEKFVFDIEQYIRDQQLKFINEITTKSDNIIDTTKIEIKTYSKEVMDQLILSYLIHHGYTGTAKAVVQNVGHVSGQELFLSSDNKEISKESEKDMEERQLIRSAIIHGNIDEAIELINKYFPGVLQEEGRGQELQLALKCGKFIEMMREYCECSKTRRLKTNSVLLGSESRSSINDNSSLDIDKQTYSKPITINNHPIPSNSASSSNGKRRLSYAAIAASLSPSNSTETPQNRTNGDMMEVDGNESNNKNNNETISSLTESMNGHIWTRRSSITNNNTIFKEDSSLANDNTSNSNHTANSLRLVMRYGQKLQEEYRHDTREKTRSSLVEIFSLLAYPDPYCSPVAYLMNISRRDSLATEVNAAILV
ncbi:uncharacterized protein BX663DRAFT_495737 [Cokeromyces recurvatus]|uniref:uncharacterized protein n=1 Tax=Cokeromyces recurvatus TaxID=90255 RepID=UPI00221F4019|nr:uncharacterized protein BX663DRAFT_495737 [Cokeromyces recurvatus]KAI7907388.1 hypothetical protein BX663DRAFT_495737 [Cokeromyces recurvatus]